MADGSNNHDPTFITLLVTGFLAILANLAGPVFTWLTHRKRKKYERCHARKHPAKRD